MNAILARCTTPQLHAMIGASYDDELVGEIAKELGRRYTLGMPGSDPYAAGFGVLSATVARLNKQRDESMAVVEMIDSDINDTLARLGQAS